MNVALNGIRTSIALAACLLATAAVAAEMYRWVDERGVVNISDTVPDKYKKTAQRMESGETEPSAAERRQAAARLQALIASAAASTPASAAETAPTRAGKPAAIASAVDGDDCATMQRRYREAQECFDSNVRTISGAVNGARMPQCPRVVDPSPRCGVPHIEPKTPDRLP